MLYSLFSEDVVLSNDMIINAIQGYNIVETINVLSLADVVLYFKARESTPNRYVKRSQLYCFQVPATGEAWYIGQFLIAHRKSRNMSIYIRALFYSYRAVVSSIKVLIDYKELLGRINSVAINDNIGTLSTPHSADICYGGKYDTVKLPFVI